MAQPQTAPCAADWTTLAYLPSTPRVNFGSSGVQPSLRAAARRRRGFGRVIGYIWAVLVVVQGFTIVNLAPWYGAIAITLGVLVIFGLARSPREAYQSSRTRWIIVLVGAGVVLAVLIGVLGTRNEPSKTDAASSLCTSLTALEASVNALTSLDPSTASKSEYQSDVTAVQNNSTR